MNISPVSVKPVMDNASTTPEHRSKRIIPLCGYFIAFPSVALDNSYYNYKTGYMDILDFTEAAQGFAAMGSEARLQVLLTLVRAGNKGLSVGDIQKRSGMPASTLAHHLRFLASANLIEQKKSGRTIINHAAYQHLEKLAGFILNECCVDENTPATAISTK